MPVTIVQYILGHSALTTTTAIYLRMSGQKAKGILRRRGLIRGKKSQGVHVNLGYTELYDIVR